MDIAFLFALFIRQKKDLKIPIKSVEKVYLVENGGPVQKYRISLLMVLGIGLYLSRFTIWATTTNDIFTFCPL